MYASQVLYLTGSELRSDPVTRCDVLSGLRTQLGEPELIDIPPPGVGQHLRRFDDAGGTRLGPFDLSRRGAGSETLESLGDSRLVTCLEGLTALDPSDLANGLISLARLTRGRAVVGVGYRPGRDGSAPGVVLPRSTWIKLLGLAGLHVVPEPRLHLGAIDPAGLPASREWPARYWRSRDLFRDGAADDVLLLERNGDPVSEQAVEAAIDDLFDLTLVEHRRQAIGGAPIDRNLVLNIHHFQDFFHFRPLLDLLSRDRLTVLVRECGGTTPLQRSAMRAWFERCGVPMHLYRCIEDLDGIDWSGGLVLSASESTATIFHCLARQVVEAGRYLGAATLLLQHGVWIEVIGETPVSFGSDRIATWGEEQARNFAKPSLYLGSPSRLAITPSNRFTTIGGARLAEASEPGDGALDDRLGLDRREFEGVALIGANLHWAQNMETDDVQADLRRVAAARRDWLFLIKPHPCERASTYDGLLAHNVRIMDDVCSVLCDVHTPRLLRGSDLVATSLSSLAVDASVAGKPIFQYDTGNPLRYEGLTPRPMRELKSFLSKPSMTAAEQVRATYADAPQAEFFTRFADLARTLSVPSRAAQDCAVEHLAVLGRLEADWAMCAAHELRLDDLDSLEASGLFDEAYYVSQLVAPPATDPMAHFLTEGVRLNLNPRAAFDTAWYLAKNEAARRAGGAAVIHYIREGSKLGLSPHPLFDPDWYAGQSPDLSDAQTALAHYLDTGENRGLSPHPFFDGQWYLGRYPDLAGLPNLLEHFIAHGQAEGRQPHPSFDLDAYVRLNPDVRNSGVGGLRHFLEHGSAEGRQKVWIPGR